MSLPCRIAAEQDLAEPFAEFPHQGQRAVDPALGREIGKAEIQDLRRQRKLAAILFDIAKLR